MLAAEQLALEGIEAEVIDVRALEPFDAETIINSVKKTGRLVIVHEACKKGGFGAETSATVQEAAFDALKKPIRRVGAPNIPVPFAPVMEKHYVPSKENVLEAVRVPRK